MKRIEVDSDWNPFFDATERFLIKFRHGKEKKEFIERYKNFNSLEALEEMNLFVDYLVEVDLYTEFPNIKITEKDIIIKKFKDGLEYFENSVL